MTSGEQQGEATSGFTLAAHSTCSRRSKRLLTPAMSYLSAFFTAIADQWCAGQSWARFFRLPPLQAPPPAWQARAAVNCCYRIAPGAREPVRLTAAAATTSPPLNRTAVPLPLLLSALLRRHPKSNPDGWIPLAVAENRVGGPAFLERLEAASIGAPPAVLNYAK